MLDGFSPQINSLYGFNGQALCACLICLQGKLARDRGIGNIRAADKELFKNSLEKGFTTCV
jgi:hypothetical protein